MLARARAGSPHVGIGDQQPAPSPTPGCGAAPAGRPADRALRRGDLGARQVQAWLDAAAAAGLQPHVAFEHLRSDHCPSTPLHAAERGDVPRRRRRVHRPLPAGPHLHGLERGQPRLAARRQSTRSRRPRSTCSSRRRARRARSSPATCSTPAPTSSGSTASRRSRAPQLWGLHNYSDVTYGTTTGTDAVLAAVPGTLWIEETGGIVVRRDGLGNVLLAYDEARAARAVTAAFALASDAPADRADVRLPVAGERERPVRHRADPARRQRAAELHGAAGARWPPSRRRSRRPA